MGSGKTSLGKRLANKLNYDFVDLDQELEKTHKMSVNELFSVHGEAYFRNLESNWLNEFEGNNVVISLGGGTPCFNNNMNLINEKGLSVYIQISLNSLTNRLYHAKNTRPIIAHVKEDVTKLKSFIKDMLNNRESDYLEANIKFDGENVSAEKMRTLIKMIQLAD